MVSKPSHKTITIRTVPKPPMRNLMEIPLNPALDLKARSTRNNVISDLQGVNGSLKGPGKRSAGPPCAKESLPFFPPLMLLY